jgi:hypothetical protein
MSWLLIFASDRELDGDGITSSTRPMAGSPLRRHCAAAPEMAWAAILHSDLGKYVRVQRCAPQPDWHVLDPGTGGATDGTGNTRPL